MALPVYVTPAEYLTYTGRAETEATTMRIAYASRLLDSRVSACNMLDTDEMAELSEEQRYAVKSWVSWMVAWLLDNNDTQPNMVHVRAGRYEERNNTGTVTFYGHIKLPDRLLAQAGLLNCVGARLI